jgi:hypothetical protein
VTVRFAPQSSPPRCHLPASAALLLALLASPAAGQSGVRLAQDTRFYKAPGAQALGTLAAGAQVMPGRTSGRSIEVTIQGWIAARSLGAFNRDGLNAVATRSESLRDSPSGSVIARVTTGVGFTKVDTQGDWVRVRRTAWVDQKAVQGGLSGPGAVVPEGPDRVEVGRRTPLSLTPGGPSVGAVDSGAFARLIARSGGWTRIQVEAWVPDSALSTTPPGVLVGLTQAEIRSEPARYVGQVVEWRLQFISLQRADELRPEIPEGASYLLTRGPLPEPGFVYVMIAADQRARFEALPALKELVIRGTIRSATTKYLPTPVLELVAVMGGRGE